MAMTVTDSFGHGTIPQMSKRFRTIPDTWSLEALIAYTFGNTHIKPVGGVSLPRVVLYGSKVAKYKIMTGTKAKIISAGRQSKRRKLLSPYTLRSYKMSKRLRFRVAVGEDGALYGRRDVLLDAIQKGGKCYGIVYVEGVWRQMGHYGPTTDPFRVAMLAHEWYDQGFRVRNHMFRTKAFQVYRALQDEEED